MKVLMVIPTFPPVLGGNQLQALTLSKGLAQLGLDVIVITGKAENAPKEESLGRLRIYRFASSKYRWMRGITFVPMCLFFILRHKKKLNLIHLHTIGWFCAPIILFAKMIKIPIILKLSSVGKANILGLPDKRFGKLLLRVLLKADRIIAVSNAVYNDILTLGYPEEKIARIPNGVNTEIFKPANPSEKEFIKKATGIENRPIVLYTGRFSPEKGLKDLLKAWQLVVRKIDKARLILVGEGIEKDELEAFARELEIAETILWIDKAYNIVEYYHCADIFVLTSYREGLSNSLLEAMACGLPCVATSVGGNCDIVIDNLTGLLVNPGKVEDIATAIIRLIEHPDLRRRFGENAYSLVVKKFALTKIIQNYVELYNTLGD